MTFAATMVVALAVEALYREVALDDFREMRMEQNVELARSLSNSIIPDVRALADLASRSSWEEMQSSPHVLEFTAHIERELENLTVYELNIFAPDGLMLYSTEHDRIGAKMLMNEGLELAAEGDVTSAIVQRNSYNRFDRMVEGRDMIETYLPLVDESGAVIAVFEIHADISNFFALLEKAQRQILAGIGIAMLFLYVVLLLLFWRSDRQLFAGRPRTRAFLFGETDADPVNRAKADFVATISHEIRTPLNAVLGMTDLLNLTSLTRKQREYIQTIQSSGDMLISLVDNLLDFSQLKSGKLELQIAEFDVMDLLERVLKIMGHSASSKGLELVGDIRHDLDLRVAADKRRLQQILVNIVNNAVKFTEQGEVVLQADFKTSNEEVTRLVFTVTDTGTGIDEKTRERLFAAFASGARPASSQPYGSGLGLTISKQLLDQMGGSIDIDSHEGGGARVRIEVPVKAVTSAIAEYLEPGHGGLSGRVLNLHGNEASAKALSRLLDRWGLACDTVLDAEEGLHRLRVAAAGGKPFGCAIIDSAILPGDRLQLVRRIRKMEEIKTLPVILLTSISEPLGVGEVSALGRVLCQNKPMLPLELRYNLLRSMQENLFASSDAQIEEDAEAHVEPGDVRILIAEDNPVSSAVLQSMLQTEGYGADVVDNGPAVLEYLESRRYDLLLLDCQMPGMDGDEASRQIRQRPGGQRPVIVAVTADTTESHRAQCVAAGMDDFMPKPLRLGSLRKGLQRWVALIGERSAGDRQEVLDSLRDNLANKTGHMDDSFMSDYIGLFLSDAEKRLDAMGKAFASGDADVVRREGHALKGSCLELGADRMARYCDELSAAAKNDNLDEVGTVIGRLDREFRRLRPVYESVQVSSTKPS